MGKKRLILLFLAAIWICLGRVHPVCAASGMNANVRFDPNGGADVSVNAKAVPVGEAYGKLPVPTRSKHKFVGWCTTANGKGAYVTADTICQTEKEHILYAIWKTKKGKIAKARPTLTIRSDDKVVERTDGRLKLRFQRVAKASGYKIRFSTTKKFKKGTYETLTLNRNDNIVFVYGIPPYKTYYVKVRAYKKVGGKKRWGKWSKVKKFTSTVR